jgi:hypothetical protein
LYHIGYDWKDTMQGHIDGIKWLYLSGYGIRLIFIAHQACFLILQLLVFSRVPEWGSLWLDIFFLVVNGYTHGSRQEGAY